MNSLSNGGLGVMPDYHPADQMGGGSTIINPKHQVIDLLYPNHVVRGFVSPKNWDELLRKLYRVNGQKL